VATIVSEGLPTRPRLPLSCAATLLALGVATAAEDRIPPERIPRIAKARSLPRGLSPAHLKSLHEAKAALLADRRAAEAKWREFASAYFTKANRGDLPVLEDWLLREAFLEPDPVLGPLARKASFHEERRAAVRRHLDDLRRKLPLVARQGATVTVPSLRVADRFEEGMPAATFGAAVPMTRAAIEREIKGWEEKVNGIGDDAQLANVDLQNVLQKQQQTMQMMSSISKMLYDTAMSVIRKIGG
jgi:hypothetical protein